MQQLASMQPCQHRHKCRGHNWHGCHLTRHQNSQPLPARLPWTQVAAQLRLPCAFAFLISVQISEAHTYCAAISPALASSMVHAV
jgi:hypothetical protein